MESNATQVVFVFVPDLVVLHPAMRNTLFCRLLSQTISRTFHSITENVDGGDLQGSNWGGKERDPVCIYRVPMDIRGMEPRAYSPRIISIGPYHHGDKKRLQKMEKLKKQSIDRLFESTQPNGVKKHTVKNAMEELEQEARSCYEDHIKISREDFVEMMLVDGCFVIELFRELKQHNFKYAPSIQRWMLPILRRDMIMLENQLPFCVLQKLFELTSSSAESNTSLGDQALQFFVPLLQGDPTLNCISKEVTGRHFLDLFRSSILPTVEEKNRTSDSYKSTESKGMETNLTNTMRSATELEEAGFIIKKGKARLLDIDLKKEGWLNKRVLKIPPLYIDDYKGTLFRNMVAFEQCHRECKPYVTSYLFFFDGLINSAEDVELLHHKQVIHHSLGRDKEVAELVNSLCKEITFDGYESNLQKVVSDANNHYQSTFAQIRAKLVHHYFRSWVVGISTLAAIIGIYLTLIQTGCTVRKHSESKTVTLLACMKHSIVDPLIDHFSFTSTKESKTVTLLACMKHSIVDPLIGHFSFTSTKDESERLKSKLANLFSRIFNFTSIKGESERLKSSFITSPRDDETNQENQSEKT
ncbi:hypothetical protein SLEP1_g34266 [Rubroshorea leprosula]|uniref:Uncharacterized protein n=1 Tax=Rubroshorea leprosula TaxID=152421 RepID=A0AAV5KJA6_9ROSI|nr:hypothetical protein SLEP1_g34266 [Rubroshorea leprosula]